MLKTDEKRTEKRTELTLSLTADELTWLEQVQATALRVYDKHHDGLAAELRETRNQWRKQAYEQGWVPF